MTVSSGATTRKTKSTPPLAVPASEPKFENYFPDCVYLNLSLGPSLGKKLGIFIELLFNEQSVAVGGKFLVRFGLRHGELRLTLKNGTMPVGARLFRNNFSASIKTKRTLSTSAKSLHSLEQGGTNEIGISKSIPEGKFVASVKKVDSAEGASGATDEFDYYRYQITIKGPADAPAWVFSTRSGDDILLGAIEKQTLGFVTLNGDPCSIDVAFEASDSQLMITGMEAPFLSLPPQKRGVICALILKYIRRNFKRIMSRGQLTYESTGVTDV